MYELLPIEFSAIVVALLRLTFICDPIALDIIFIKLIELVTFSPLIVIVIFKKSFDFRNDTFYKIEIHY
jgi:hypothetical protein